jgi:hypothetical protein
MYEGENEMNKVGILATQQARAGKKRDVEEFLSLATPLVAAEIFSERPEPPHTPHLRGTTRIDEVATDDLDSSAR